MTASLPLPFAAFVAGLVSFVTPCVLPLVPGYISLISGAAVDEIRRADARLKRTVLTNAGLFICGFTIVFMALGATASVIGSLLQRHVSLLSKIAGAVVVAFGLHKTGILTIPRLDRDVHVTAMPSAGSSWRAILVGVAFGFGWTPCVGPILTVILTFAASEATVGKGIGLLSLYSAGLALPFLLTALGIERFLTFYQGFRRYLRPIEIASGVVMIVIGSLIFVQRFALLNTWMNRIPVLHRIGEGFQ